MADDLAQPVEAPRRRSNARAWILGIAVVLAGVFILLNSNEVKINFIFGEAKMSLVFALAISTLLGFMIGWLSARWRTHHRD